MRLDRGVSGECCFGSGAQREVLERLLSSVGYPSLGAPCGGWDMFEEAFSSEWYRAFLNQTKLLGVGFDRGVQREAKLKVLLQAPSRANGPELY